MKSIFSTIIALFIIQNSFAGDLTLTSLPSATAGKTGKISLTITGGFAPYVVSWTGPSGYVSTKINPDSLAAGTYCVTVTDQYCGIAKSCVVVNESTNGIQESFAQKWKVYPNPFKAQINIDFAGTISGNVTLYLMDAMGKVVAEKQTNTQQNIQIDLQSALASGIYLLTVATETGEQYRRLLISSGN